MVWPCAETQYQRFNSCKLGNDMKVGLICYHSNIYKIYPSSWIDKYRDSILNQTFKDFEIYEVDYSMGYDHIFNHSISFVDEFPTFVHTMNWILEVAFQDCDCVFNTNCDDYYNPKWIEYTLKQIRRGYDLVSCNFKLFNEKGIYHVHNFELKNIKRELDRGNNIICHPGVCYSKRFWERGNRYIPEEIPREDLLLW